MNYFGHAAIATWCGVAPAAVLGSMLPDFASMCGARLGEQPDAVVAAGIALHHRTDKVFHTLAPVAAVMRELEARLAELGCARGPQLATGHVGVELLLDGVLVEDPASCAGYLAAIASDATVGWVEGGDARYRLLLDRLRGYGVPDDLKTVDGVMHRLRRVLGARPRLAPNDKDLVAMQRALEEAQPRIVVAADTIMRAMKAGL